MVAVPESVIGHGLGTPGPLADAVIDQFPVVAEVSVACAEPATCTVWKQVAEKVPAAVLPVYCVTVQVKFVQLS